MVRGPAGARRSERGHGQQAQKPSRANSVALPHYKRGNLSLLLEGLHRIYCRTSSASSGTPSSRRVLSTHRLAPVVPPRIESEDPSWPGMGPMRLPARSSRSDIRCIRSPFVAGNRLRPAFTSISQAPRRDLRVLPALGALSSQSMIMGAIAPAPPAGMHWHGRRCRPRRGFPSTPVLEGRQARRPPSKHCDPHHDRLTSPRTAASVSPRGAHVPGTTGRASGTPP